MRGMGVYIGKASLHGGGGKRHVREVEISHPHCHFSKSLQMPDVSIVL
jgi:hypothetical protein